MSAVNVTPDKRRSEDADGEGGVGEGKASALYAPAPRGAHDAHTHSHPHRIGNRNAPRSPNGPPWRHYRSITHLHARTRARVRASVHARTRAHAHLGHPNSVPCDFAGRHTPTTQTPHSFGRNVQCSTLPPFPPNSLGRKRLAPGGGAANGANRRLLERLRNS